MRREIFTALPKGGVVCDGARINWSDYQSDLRMWLNFHFPGLLCGNGSRDQVRFVPTEGDSRIEVG